MLKAYLSVICASLILADTRGYHAQLSTVASYMDMISVIFTKGKLLKLHAPMSIHTTSVSPCKSLQNRLDLRYYLTLNGSFRLLRVRNSR